MNLAGLVFLKQESRVLLGVFLFNQDLKQWESSRMKAGTGISSFQLSIGSIEP